MNKHPWLCSPPITPEEFADRVNPPFNHADDSVVRLWNQSLEELPCTSEET
jgi:hypothetical protein